MQRTDDATLARSAGKGDASSFDELVRRYQGNVRAYFAARLRDFDAVDDLSQDVFLIVFRRLDTFDASKPFYPWLMGIAANVLRNAWRKRVAQTAANPDELDATLDDLAVAEAEKLERMSGHEDLVEALRQCCQSLQGTSAHIIQEYYGRGRTLLSLSAELGKTPGALGIALLRIRRNLRACVQERMSRTMATEVVRP